MGVIMLKKNNFYAHAIAANVSSMVCSVLGHFGVSLVLMLCGAALIAIGYLYGED
jgi:hypothetical protein